VFSLLKDSIFHNGKYFAEKTAIYYKDREISFSEHFEFCSLLASSIKNAGLVKQDRVAVMSMNRPEFLEIYGAAELSGIIVATINFRLTITEVESILLSSKPKMVFFEEQYADMFFHLKSKLQFIEHFISIGDSLNWAQSYKSFLCSGPVLESEYDYQISENDILQLIYTSGTTGTPKGVMRSHRSEIHAAELLATELGIKIDDRVQLMMPLFHVGSRWLQMAAHLRGAAIVLHHEFNAKVVVREMERRQVTLSHMAPTMIQAVLEEDFSSERITNNLHTICYSAAPMSVPLLKKGIERFGNVFLQLYAMTESAGGTTLHKFQHFTEGTAQQVRQLASVGQPMKGVKVRIVDSERNEVSVGETGEISLFTDARMAGYWNNPEATKEVLHQGWYLTGDMGTMDSRGFIYLVDRKKDMIITGGENVYSREVENTLLLHPAVLDCAVIGIPDDRWGESVHAVVVKRKNATVTEKDLIDHCRNHIASYKKPKTIDFANELPRLASGKIDKVSLRKNKV